MSSIKSLKPNFNSTYQQGYFRPINAKKYLGDTNNIIFRSSWERKFMSFCDNSESVISWSSEPVEIQYISPLDNKFHKYYLDFYANIKDAEGNSKRYFIEIKPSKFTQPKIKSMNETQNMSFAKLNKYKEYLGKIAVNYAKWNAAKIYAANNGCVFEVWTEHTIKNLK